MQLPEREDFARIMHLPRNIFHFEVLLLNKYSACSSSFMDDSMFPFDRLITRLELSCLPENQKF